MDECKICANADNEYCFACDNGNQFKPITNADRIRSMSDEKLADYLRWHNDLYSRNGKDWLDWLREECE